MMLLARGEAGLIWDEDVADYQTPEGQLRLQMLQSNALGGIPGHEAMAKFEYERAKQMTILDR